MKLLNRSFLLRTLSGAAFVAVVAGATLLSFWSFAALMAVIFCGCVWELHRMSARNGAKPLFYYPVAAGVAILAACAIALKLEGGFFAGLMLAPAIIIPLFLVVPIIELYRKQPDPLTNIGSAFTTFTYLLLPVCMMLYIAHAAGQQAVMWFWGIIWANDVGAYIFGVLFGRHKLFKRISPNKSWEGLFGGIITAAAVAIPAAAQQGDSLAGWLVLAVAVSIAGVFGDLVESMIKRSAGVKDSGSMMPGHGGFLDRFDAMLYAAPFATLLFLILIR